MSPAPTRSYADSRADQDQIATPSRWTLPGQRHWATGTDSVPGLVIAGATPPPQQIDLTTLHPLAHRMGEALELLAQFHHPYAEWSDGFLRTSVVGVSLGARIHATRALLRAAGLLPPENAP